MIESNFEKSTESSHSDLSIVIPVFNEAEVLPELFARVKKVLTSLNLNYEVIFVDDGSIDNSLEILKDFYSQDKRSKTISFSRNFGHQIAVSAGLEMATGQAVIIIDADLQDPPEIIPDLIKRWQEGYKVVYGVRKKRKENFFKRAAYKIYYQLLHKLANINVPLDSGDFCLMDKQIVKLINSFPERTRFIRGLRSWVGFRQIGVEYERDRRFAGKSKYTFRKLLNLALDGVLSFSGAPLKLAIFLGFFISGLSLIYALIVGLLRIFYTTNQIPGWSTIVAAVNFLGGVQLMVTGLIGEYISRIFNEVKHRPLYITKEEIGFDKKEGS